MIDILLSTYNGEKYLAEQLDSLLLQSFQDITILIRDDMSTDTTIDIIEQYKTNYPEIIKIIPNYNQNLGSSRSFFELLKYSCADYIMFCDQDDVWNVDKVKLCYDFYNQNCLQLKSPVLIHTNVDVVNQKLEINEKLTEVFNASKNKRPAKLKWYIFQNNVTGCTVFINSLMRDIVNSIDYSHETIIQHDWLLAQIAFSYNSLFHISKATMKYRQHGNNSIGVKKKSFFSKLKDIHSKGVSYKYYDQAKILCKLYSNKECEEYRKLLEFSELSEYTKLKRIIWHLKNNYFREGNIFYKIYQLISC